MNTRDSVIYQTQDGAISMNVLVEDDTVRLTQAQTSENSYAINPDSIHWDKLESFFGNVLNYQNLLFP
jgi:hypothetical protein